METKYGLALGANAGARKLQLRAARELIRRELASRNTPFLVAPLYITAPVDCEPDARSFYNTCIEIESTHSPAAILAHCQEIEHRLGRPPSHPRNAPRTIDIDILYADQLVLDSPELTIPHPRLSSRRFVLEPLAEIRPDLTLPGLSAPVSSLLRDLESSEPPIELKAQEW
ncbi:MAG: 2-amino-4-hydroxy-6-hydroxymethyldihydropteridine diphosphokinase [Verrucomicrobiota bacterium]